MSLQNNQVPRLKAMTFPLQILQIHKELYEMTESASLEDFQQQP